MPTIEETVTTVLRDSVGGTLNNTQMNRLRPVVNRISELLRARLRSHPNTTPAQLSEMAESIVTDLTRAGTNTRSELITLARDIMRTQEIDQTFVSDDMIIHTLRNGRTRGEIINFNGTVVPPENVPSLPSLLGPLLRTNHGALVEAYRDEGREPAQGPLRTNPRYVPDRPPAREMYRRETFGPGNLGYAAPAPNAGNLGQLTAPVFTAARPVSVGGLPEFS